MQNPNLFGNDVQALCEDFGLSNAQLRRLEQVSTRATMLPDSGLRSHHPSDMLRGLRAVGLDPQDDDDMAVWYVLAGLQWPMFDMSDEAGIRELAKPRSDWFRFRRNFTSRDGWDTITALPESVNIYRGVCDRRRLQGWSYSTNRDVAIDFALGRGMIRDDPCPEDLVSLLLHATVNRSDVIAAVNDRYEAELIVDPLTVHSPQLIELYDLKRGPDDEVTSYRMRPYCWLRG